MIRALAFAGGAVTALALSGVTQGCSGGDGCESLPATVSIAAGTYQLAAADGVADPGSYRATLAAGTGGVAFTLEEQFTVGGVPFVLRYDASNLMHVALDP